MFICTVIVILSCFILSAGKGFKQQVCTRNEYGVVDDHGILKCQNCTNLPKCASGLGLSIACGEVVHYLTEIHCLHCIAGVTFSTTYDSKPCQSCNSINCHHNEKIIGKCKVDNDTSSCGGVCKTGFYSKHGDSFEDCEPCSHCQNYNSVRVKKCEDDGMPWDKQCQEGMIGTIKPSHVNTLTQGSLRSMENESDKTHQRYRFYGHPGWLSFTILLLLIIAIFAFITVRRKCRKRKSPAKANIFEQMSSTALNQIKPEASGVGDNTADVTVRQRKPSTTGSNGKKTSLARQNSNNSNSQSGSDIHIRDETSMRSYDLDNGCEEKPSNTPEIINEQKLSSSSAGRRNYFFSSDDFNLGNPTYEETKHESDDFKENLSISVNEKKRLRKPSFSSMYSEKKNRVFKRQNSNPNPGQEEKAPTHKRRNTVSSIASICSINKNDKKGDEETTSLLDDIDHNDNDISSHIVTLPDQSAPHSLSGLAIGKINCEIFRQVCNKLNDEDILNDWQTLAGIMNYSSGDVKRFKQSKDPAYMLLNSWGVRKGNDVAKLIKYLKEMGRNDVVTLLESGS